MQRYNMNVIKKIFYLFCLLNLIMIKQSSAANVNDAEDLTTNNCNGNVSVTTSGDSKAGTYMYQDPEGKTHTVYTTGEKNPSTPNNCQPQPVIQPYIYQPVPMPRR